MVTVIRCPFCAGMYEVLQPPVAGALLRCPNCQQTFTFGPLSGARPFGNLPPKNLPPPMAPSLPPPIVPSLPMPDFTTPSQAPVPGGPRPPAPVINISIPTITNPNARPAPSATPPEGRQDNK
jgi:hypothetical protein